MEKLGLFGRQNSALKFYLQLCDNSYTHLEDIQAFCPSFFKEYTEFFSQQEGQDKRIPAPNTTGRAET